MKKLLTIALLAVFSACCTVVVQGADTQPAPAEKKGGKSGQAPFNGKAAAVDKAAKTLQVGQRTFVVTSTTRITKAGKPATFDELAEGEQVGGAYRKTEDGKLELISLRIGPKPAAPEGEKKQKEKQ
jgi:hypothetical protein